MPQLFTQDAIHRIAARIGEPMLDALKDKRIARIDIDVIRSAIMVASIYEGLTGDEMEELERKLLADVIRRVG